MQVMTFRLPMRLLAPSSAASLRLTLFQGRRPRPRRVAGRRLMQFVAARSGDTQNFPKIICLNSNQRIAEAKFIDASMCLLVSDKKVRNGRLVNFLEQVTLLVGRETR